MILRGLTGRTFFLPLIYGAVELALESVEVESGEEGERRCRRVGGGGAVALILLLAYWP